MEELLFFQTDPQDEALHFTSPHWVSTPAPYDRHLVTITGAAKLDFRGENSAEWRASRLRLVLRFPDICPPNKWFQIEHWAPFVTISGIDKGGDNHNGGWAVDDFGLEMWGSGGKIREAVGIWANIRVRGSEFCVFRVGYTLTVSGVFVDPPPGPDD
jgi:hypothetical protein